MDKKEFRALRPGQHVKVGTIEYVILQTKQLNYGAFVSEMGIVVSPILGYWIQEIGEGDRDVKRMEVVDA